MDEPYYKIAMTENGQASVVCIIDCIETDYDVYLVDDEFDTEEEAIAFLYCWVIEKYNNFFFLTLNDETSIFPYILWLKEIFTRIEEAIG